MRVYLDGVQQECRVDRLLQVVAGLDLLGDEAHLVRDQGVRQDLLQGGPVLGVHLEEHLDHLREYLFLNSCNAHMLIPSEGL